MSDNRIVESGANTHPETDNSNIFKEINDFCLQTMNKPDARARQAIVALNGLVIGGIKDIPNEIVHHPIETTGKVVLAAGAGIGVTALLGLGSPYIAGGTLIAGGALLGAAVTNTWNKACSDKQMSQAMNATWNGSDMTTLQNSMRVAEERLGRDGFDYGVGFAAGAAGVKFAPAVLSRFAPKTIWRITPNPQWVKQSDGTQIATDEFAATTYTKYKDGTIKKTTDYGDTTTLHPKGGMTQEYANGVKVERLTDGTKTTTYPDGKSSTVYRDGDRITKFPNGNEVTQTAEGNIRIDKADGTTINNSVNGYKTTFRPNGDQVYTKPDGSKSMYDKKDTAFYDIKPNGQRVLNERWKDTVPKG